MTPKKAEAVVVKKETKSSPRDLSAAERRERFLLMKSTTKDDWRILKSDVVEELIPYGILTLDNMLQLGGLPRRGRVIQFHGGEHGGKSTLCYKICANYQKLTGEPVVINDFEGTSSWAYLKTIGVNPDLAELYTPDSVEESCKRTLEHMLNGTRLFVFDSIPSMKTKVPVKEIMNGKAFKPTMGAHARAMTLFFDTMIPHAKEHDCTFLMVNQTRARIENSQEATNAQKYPSFTNLPYTLPGGKHARYLMSTMLEVNVKKAYKEGDEFLDEFILGPHMKEKGDFIATEIACRILKNKVTGGGYRGGSFWMRPGRGIDDYITIRQLAREYDLIAATGGGKASKWIVGNKENPIATYNTKAEAVQDLTQNPINYTVLDELRPLVAAAIDQDKVRFKNEVDDSTRAYLEGETDFYEDVQESSVQVKTIAVDELD